MLKIDSGCRSTSSKIRVPRRSISACKELMRDCSSANGIRQNGQSAKQACACFVCLIERDRSRQHVRTQSPAAHRPILVQEAKPHELEGINQGDLRGWLHLAVAAWDSDSNSSSYLPAPGLHLRGVTKG